MPPDDDAAFLWDMLHHARMVVKFTQGESEESAERNDAARLAIERAIEIIGEAARGVSEETRATNPDIPWKKIVQQRHVIAHEYGAVTFDRIWRVATVHVPLLVRQLESIVPPPPAAEPDSAP